MLFSAALLITHAAEGRDIKFEASLDAKRIAIGERAQLGLTFYGNQNIKPPELPNMDGLEVRYLGPSSMMTVINGRISTSITHMYSIVPLKVGKFTLGPFKFTYEGDNYTSNELILEVSEEKPSSRNDDEAAVNDDITQKLNLSDRIFVVLRASRASAYINELIPVTVKLYVNALNVSDIQLPTFSQEGFSKIEFKEPKQYREEVSGLIYDVLEFKTNIFGTRPGDYRLGPAKIKCNIMVRKRTKRSSASDFFDDDPYMDSFFQGSLSKYERHPVELKSQDIPLIISPLPTEGRPKNFSGAVGDYQFIYNVSPTKVKAGDPVTVQMEINGTGNFNTVLIPRLETVDGFKAYDAEVRTEEHRKLFKQVLIPETDTVTEIPKAIFNYFDPQKKVYKTIAQGPVPIQVEKGKEEAPAQVVGPVVKVSSSDQKEDLKRNIIYIKDSPGRMMRTGRFLYQNKVFQAVVAAPLMVLLGLYILESRRNRLRMDTVYAGRLFAIRSARKGLRQLKERVRQKDQALFYEELFSTLQNYFGNRLHMPPAGITFAAVQSSVSSKPVDQEMIRKLKNLFEISDQARFAGFKVDELRLKDDLKEMAEVIKYFERMRL